MKKSYKIITVLMVFSFLFNSCETTELDLRDDPNNLIPGQADPQLVFNGMQISFINVINGMNGFTMDYTRMTQLFGAYASDPVFFDNIWSSAYASFLQDATVMIPVAEENELYTHAGAAKVLKAYLLVTLVDFFGDVPYSEANQGTDFPSPSLDDDAQIYQEALAIIEDALSDLAKDAPTITSDLYFDGDKDKWTKLAKTLKLKIYLQTRLVNSSESATQINALLAENDLINSEDDDFVFNYSTVQTPTDSRHPIYVSNYNNGTPTGAFMSNNYMYYLKSNDDPRIRYYFYRQSLEDPTSSDLPCLDFDFDYCYLGDGYFGRDHADDTFTTSSMHQKNTTWGVYPVGGKFDDDSGGTTNQSSNSGADGQGITPIMLSSYVKFMKAEAALTLGTSGNPVTYLEQGINESITKTISFGNLGNNDDSGFEPDAATINAFIDGISSNFSNANSQDKLDIVMRQYLIALWGNGIEAYNNYRRTGLPSDIQSPQLPAGPFPRVNLYPSNAVNLNNNISQQTVTNQVFWDTNPSGFID